MVLEDDYYDHVLALQFPQISKYVVVILNNKEKGFFFIRINSTKPIYLLIQASCSKIKSGESSIQAAHKEIYEEIGFSIAHYRFKYIGNDFNYNCDFY